MIVWIAGGMGTLLLYGVARHRYEKARLVEADERGRRSGISLRRQGRGCPITCIDADTKVQWYNGWQERFVVRGTNRSLHYLKGCSVGWADEDARISAYVARLQKHTTEVSW